MSAHLMRATGSHFIQWKNGAALISLRSARRRAANPDVYNVAENSTNSFSPLVNDVVRTPGGSLTIIGLSPTNGTATISGTNVIFVPTLNFVGMATIGYTITDNVGGTNNSVITVNVTNLPPVAFGQSGTTTENTALPLDRKSTRLNSSHLVISYAVF